MPGWKVAPATIVVAICLAGMPGCHWSDSPPADADEDPVLTADGADDEAPAKTHEQTPEVPLKRGDRFPLQKTVEHTLRQPSAQGSSVSRSNLKILLSVTVQEIRPAAGPESPAEDPHAGGKRLAVQYDRVQFSQELPGRKKVEYDSDDPVSPIPPAAQGYHGLKDNRFEFWLNRNNQVIEIVAFEQFLDRCLRDVPAARQKPVREAMAATSVADGIANFVDDSVGLLPPSAVREGDVWARDRQVLQPVPMHSSTRYVLRRITDEIAKVEVTGSLSPLVTGRDGQPRPEVDIAIRGGQSVGSCILDRRTGLPLNSKVTQSLDMTVRLSNGTEFEQHRSTVTTITSFPEQGCGETPLDGAPDSRSNGVVQAAGRADAPPVGGAP